MAEMSAMFVVQMISTAVAVGVSIYTALNMDEPDKVGSKVQKRGTRSPRKVPYGKSIIDSTNVYNNVYDKDNSWMLNIFSLGVGEITQIHQVYVNDLPLLRNEYVGTNRDPYFSYKENDFVDAYDTQKIEMELRHGQPRETPLIMGLNYSDGEWTTAHRGDRVPQVGILVDRDDDVDTPIFSANYTLTALVSGLPVYDPRYLSDGEKDYRHSDYVNGIYVPPESRECGRNPALCLLDFITNTYYGMALPMEYVDIESFIDAANWCDANELHCDGAVDTGEPYASCLNEILSSFQGVLTIKNGLVCCKYEDVVALPYDTVFDEDTIIELTDVVGSNSESYCNIVETEYKNHGMREKGDVFQIPADIYTIPEGETKSRIEKDGFIKTTNLEMPMTIDNYNSSGVNGAVKFFTNRVYLKALYQRGCKIKIDLSEHQVDIYDVIKISNKALEWDEELFRIVNIERSVNDEEFNVATLSCTEYNDAIYDGSEDGLTGRGRFKDYTELKAVENLVFSLENFVTDGYGSLTWDDPNTIGNVNYLVQYKRSTEDDDSWVYLTTVTDPIARTPNLKLGDYDFRVQVRRYGWAASPFTTLLNAEVSSTVLLPTPTSFTVIPTGSDFTLTWDDMTVADILNPADPSDPDSGGTSDKVIDYFSHYEIKIYHDVTLVGTYKSTTPDYVYTFNDNLANGKTRTITAEVAIVSKDEQKSGFAQDTASNTQMPAPSGVTAVTNVGTIEIAWEPRTEGDFSGTEIHMSTTSNFTPDGSTLIGDTQQASTFNIAFPADELDRYIKVGHYDVFGKDSMTYTSSYPVTYEPVFDDSELRNDLDNLQTELDNLDNQLNNPVNGLQKQLDDLDDQLNDPSTGLQKELNDLDDQLNNPSTGLQKQLDDLNTELDNAFPITETDISDDAISTPKIQANAITALKIAANTITANEIAADTITANEIAANTITTNEIAADTITANDIAANTITANEIKADTILANNIAADTITANEIAADTITANEIKADTITALEIAANTITANEIKADTITAGNIAANTITANEIAANTITANQIAADTITASEIVSDIVFGVDAQFTGTVQLVGSTHMRISSATGFGSSNQFIEWFGVKMLDGGGNPNTSLLTESNAITYLKTNGDAYFGGSLSAGTFKNAAVNSQIGLYTVGSYPITLDEFGTNGDSKSVVVSWTLQASSVQAGSCPASPIQPSVSWTLQRSLDSGNNWTNLVSGTFNGTTNGVYDPENTECLVTETASESYTYTDNSGSLSNFMYRIQVTGRSRYHADAFVQSQKIGIVSTEE